MMKGIMLIATFFYGLVCCAQQTSDHNEKLRQALKKYPQADTDGNGVLTMQEAQKYREQMEPSSDNKKKGQKYAVQPTFANEKYGPYRRNVLDFWQAEVDGPAPVLVYIHGGGFVGGSKEKAANSGLIKSALEQGMHFASINYRYRFVKPEHLGSEQRTGIPGCMLDGTRAVQYLKANAKMFNINKERVIVFGSSAGGCITIMMGLHDDLAITDSDDPVLRESSRVFALGHFNSQPTTIPDRFVEILGFPKEKLEQLVKKRPLDEKDYVRLGFRNEDEMVANPELVDQYKAMQDMASHASSDDPPIFIANTLPNLGLPKSYGELVHHPKLSLCLHDKCRAVGMQTESYVCATQGVPKSGQYSAFMKWVTQLLEIED